eukprot:scaffold2779_cov114-Isochrysis_galbana.AAC.4
MAVLLPFRAGLVLSIVGTRIGVKACGHGSGQSTVVVEAVQADELKRALSLASGGREAGAVAHEPHAPKGVPHEKLVSALLSASPCGFSLSSSPIRTYLSRVYPPCCRLVRRATRVQTRAAAPVFT